MPVSSSTRGAKLVRGLKPMSPGMDFAKVPTGYVSNKDGYQELNSEPPEQAPMLTQAQVFELFSFKLGTFGFELRAVPGGVVAGFDVFVKSYADDALVLNSDGFTYKKRLTIDDHEYTSFRSAVEATANNVRAECTDETMRKAITEVAKTLLDRPRDTKTNVFHYALGIQQNTLPRTLTGVKEQYKYVPLREWFSENVRQLDASYLLGSLLPDAEVKLLMLTLGRVLAGKGGTKTVEGTIPDIPFAAFSILVGMEGGEGKSTLFNKYLIPTLSMMGYRVEAVNPNQSRFSKMWVTSDLGWADDMTDTGHKKLLQDDPLLKSAASGATVKVEEKGIQEREVQATATLIGCANGFNPEWLFNSDAGVIRRYNPLRCYSERELQVMYGDNWKRERLRERWLTTAERLGCTPFTLAAWLCRLSLDYYMDVAGLRYENEVFRWNWQDCRLEEEYKTLRRSMAINVEMTHTTSLVEAMELATLASIKTMDARNQAKLMQHLDDIPLTPKALHTVIEVWRHQLPLPESLGKMYVNEICPTSRATWDAQTDLLHNDCSTAKNTSKVWERILETLLVKDKGWRFQLSMSKYVGMWQMRRTTFRAVLEGIDIEQVDELTYNYLKELGDHLLTVTGVVHSRKRGK